MINIKNFDQNNIEILNKNIVFYIGCVTPNSIKLLYLINNANGYIEKSNGNKYLTLLHTRESKDSL